MFGFLIGDKNQKQPPPTASFARGGAKRRTGCEASERRSWSFIPIKETKRNAYLFIIHLMKRQ
jgi:hypothetical protein